MAYNVFIAPREIYYGTGALNAIAGVPGKRILCVTDSGVRSQGLVDKLETILKEKGAETTIYDQVEPDPSRETIGKIAELANEFNPDLIIGLGGGSSIDAGKGAWVLYENPDFMKCSVMEVIPKILGCVLRQKARYAAIPTTSGTGSEVTRAAVITDNSITPPYKGAWNAPQIVPDIAICDPELTISMPPQVTANTGFDALSHAIECFVLINPSDLVDSEALWSARNIFTWLPKAVAEGKNLEARDKMHMAALQAGLAFANGTLGLVHSIAHIMGAEFHIPHGRAIAYALNPVFEFFYKTGRRARLVQLADALSMKGDTDKAKVSTLLSSITKLKQDVGIPTAIKDSDLSEEKYFAGLDAMIKSYENRIALIPPNMKPFFIMPETIGEVRDLFLRAWTGEKTEL
ncbi:MAG: iron-containing alcohol dehydrogenase [Deltaproteobacteria bacterium]|nr:iron-containing alcohol dehydrogenase [Deltaproteobacteria bacterium]